MRLIVCWLLFLSSNLLLGQVEQPAPEIRVMTFNIRYDNPQDGKFAWKNRRENVCKMLDFHRVDIAGMQEVLKNQLADLRGGASEFSAIGIGRKDGKDRGEFSPILYRKERFKLLKWGTFWLSETPQDTGSVGWDAALERICTWAHFQERTHSQSFFIFNTHFDHRGQNARRQSVNLIKRKISQIAAGAPVILCGDFNLEENSAVYHEILSGAPQLIDSRHAARLVYGPEGTFTGFNIRPERLKTIDFIFAGPQWSILRQGTLSENWNGLLPSDHRPVIADFAVVPQ